MDNTLNPHAVLVCSPGLGHLIPALELGKRFADLHSFKFTILLVTTHTTNTRHPSGSPPNNLTGVDLVEVPAADISGIVDPEAKLVKKICVLMRETIPAIKAAIASLRLKPSVLVFDMFATEYVPMARELRVPSFVYLTSSAWFLALTLCCPILDKEVEGEYVDQTEPLKLPGCKPVRPEDVVDPMLERKDPQYEEYRRMGVEIPMFDGVLSNTWQDLERSTLAAFMENDIMRKIIQAPVYEIGPLTRTAEPGPYDQLQLGLDKSKCNEILEWLDRQPGQSVMYVSFGSGGTLSKPQMAELAWGLELSEQRFVWVVRPPSEVDASGTYFGLNNCELDDLRDFLPDGFVDRTKDRGLLIPKWAPQIEVLSHPSVGGFLTHCGWNSVLESITNGVPMIAWPMYAEQRMNATMLVEELEVATRPSELPANKVVGREEVEKMVRMVLEGEEGRCMRRRVEDLQKSARRALSEGGPSYERLSQFVKAL